MNKNLLKNQPYLLLGLGNKGDQYTNTYHNIAWLIMDELVSSDTWIKDPYVFGSTATLEYNQTLIHCIKPTTMMNRSGLSARAACRRFQVDASRIIVMHDDLDVEFPRIKISMGRGSGGHNGVKSVFQHLGTNKVARIRVGIARRHFDRTIKPQVLKDIPKTLLDDIPGLALKVKSILKTTVQQGIETAMNLANQKNTH